MAVQNMRSARVGRAGVLAAVVVLGSGAGCLAVFGPPAEYEPAPRLIGRLEDERIAEASGLAASRRHADHFYVHNDSGDLPRVFLIDRSGRTRLEIRLQGAQARDYEDIAMAPGDAAGQWDVCVADIGDNSARRSTVVVYRFPEPELPADGAPLIEVTPQAFTFKYADGPADAEAFCVHPETGDGYILTKRTDGRSFVYKLAAPWSADEVRVLPKLAEVRLPAPLAAAGIVTAADIGPDGRRLAVRCYFGGWEWRLPEGLDVAAFDRIWQAEPAALSLALERQGEALCYAADGRSLLTVSEGLHPGLYEVRARSTD